MKIIEKKTKLVVKKDLGPNEGDSKTTEWAENIWNVSWTYIKTVVDTIHEPFLVLDKDLRVMAANKTFYKCFKVSPKSVEKKLLYDLGDGQWDIPALRKLLEDILPKDTFFRGFQVAHTFPVIGRKVMILNARRVYNDIGNAPKKGKKKPGKAAETEGGPEKGMKPIILLAIEDITELTLMVEKLASTTKEYKVKMSERAGELSKSITELKNLNHTITGFKSIITHLTALLDGFKLK